MSCPGWASGGRSLREAWPGLGSVALHQGSLPLSSLLTAGLLLKRVSLVIMVGMIPGQSSSAHSPLPSCRVRALRPLGRTAGLGTEHGPSGVTTSSRADHLGRPAVAPPASAFCIRNPRRAPSFAAPGEAGKAPLTPINRNRVGSRAGRTQVQAAPRHLPACVTFTVTWWEL